MSGEVVLAYHFVMDALIVCLSGRMCGLRATAARVLLAAALGAAQGVLAVYAPVLGTPLGVCAGAGAMALGAFAPCGPRDALRAGAVITVAGLALSGAVAYAEALMGGVPAMLAAVALAAALWLAAARCAPARARAMVCEITLAGMPLRMAAMLDTGNLLRDPVTRLPVIVAPRAVIARAVPQALDMRADAPRLIRVRTAAGTYWVPVLKPERVRLCAAGGRLIECRAVLALAPDSYGGHQALVPAALCEANASRRHRRNAPQARVCAKSSRVSS